LVDERLIFETALAQRSLVDSARKTTRTRRNKERLQHLQRTTIATHAASDSAQATEDPNLPPRSGGVVVSQEPLSHLNAPYRAYALLSASERVQWIRQDRWIHYSRAEQVLNRLTDLLTYPARDRIPTARWRSRPAGIVVLSLPRKKMSRNYVAFSSQMASEYRNKDIMLEDLVQQ
jgi:hypothetical protein